LFFSATRRAQPAWLQDRSEDLKWGSDRPRDRAIHLRQREYPQPPPPSKSTRRTIIRIVSMAYPHLSEPDRPGELLTHFPLHHIAGTVLILHSGPNTYCWPWG
jgi:hypothetical protein